MLTFVIFLLMVFGGVWAYNKLFHPCGCKE